MSEIPLAARYTSTETTATISAYSYASDDVTFSAGAGSFSGTMTMTGVSNDGDGVNDSWVADSGNDRHYGLFVSTQTITGLSSGTSVPFTMTQNGETISGTIVLDSGIDAAVPFAFVSCDAWGEDAKGTWGDIRAKAEAGLIKAVVHTDDHGYVDRMFMNSGFSGNLRWYDNRTNKNAYGYTAAYGAYLGLLAESTTFHHADRIWCHHNLPTYVGTGDHELINNPESAGTVTTAQRDLLKTSYQGTIGAPMPFINATNSMASVIHIGCTEVVIYDRTFAIMNNSDLYDSLLQVNSGGFAAGETWLSANQISDIIGAVNTESPFKCMANGAGIYMMLNEADRVTADINGWPFSAMGSQDPLDGYTVDGNLDSDWTELMTNIANNGIAVKAQSYGAGLYACHGDTHRPYVYNHYKPARSGHVRLDIMEFSSGTVNANKAHSLMPVFKPGVGLSGSNAVWYVDWTPRDTGSIVNRSTYLHITPFNDGEWKTRVDNIEVHSDDGTYRVELLHRTIVNPAQQSSAPEYLRRGYL